MAANLGNAYVQIMPSARGIGGNISRQLNGEMGSAGTAAGGLFGGNFAGAAMKLIGAIGIGKMFADTIAEAGALQQSFGGLETIYGDAAVAAKEYAAQAAAAGISSNDFAEQAVAFGAALRQAYGGDTAQAIEAANVAILDMADNAAKMGTPIESIQAAYQGFARGQYQLLDNLRLGYGGTKSEMERLLRDAEAISGVHYDIDNLGDVYDAIHVIQEELGVAGVAAKEAETTLTGSFGAMKAAAANLMGNLALGEDITDELNTLMQSVGTWARNLLPLVANALRGLPQVISAAMTGAIVALRTISANADGIVSFGVDLIKQLVLGIGQALPALAEAAVNIVMALGQALFTTDWAGMANEILTGLKNAMSVASAEIFGSDQSIIQAVMTSITNNLPMLLEKGVEIVTNVINGILQNIPTLVTAAGELINQFVGFIAQSLPIVMQKGVELVLNLVNGIISNLPQIVTSVMQIIAQFLATVATNLPRILQSGIELLGKLAAGIIQAIPDLVGKIPQVIQSIVNAFGSFDWLSIGVNIITGIGNGIVNAGSTLITSILSLCEGAFDAVKNFFGIKSPSKLMEDKIGKMIPPGIAIGIMGNTAPLKKAMSELGEIASGSYSMNIGTPMLKGKSELQMDALLALLNRYLPLCAEKVTIDGDSLVSGINRQLGVAYL